ncbi:hypothetical protein ACQP1G_14425 [Nocardia sp. CA-107356]|uniref:hypothetical protein n=1 Tax=Nocardia sp. CA-107356 TaxID=3239972 RepID=UPI003D8F69AD
MTSGEDFYIAYTDNHRVRSMQLVGLRLSQVDDQMQGATVQELAAGVDPDVVQPGALTVAVAPQQVQPVEAGVSASPDTTFVIVDAEGNPAQRVTLINASSAVTDEPSATATEVVITFDDIKIENIE